MNRNTKRAREKGFSSMKDLLSDGHKIFYGEVCKTANPSNKRKTYKKPKNV